MAVTENSGGSPDRAAQQSEFPMQRLSQQTRQDNGPNDGEHSSDSTRLYDFVTVVSFFAPSTIACLANFYDIKHDNSGYVVVWYIKLEHR